MNLKSKTSDLTSAGSNEKSIRVNSNILNQRDFFTQFNMTSSMKKKLQIPAGCVGGHDPCTVRKRPG
jgi:hypothetical protein